MTTNLTDLTAEQLTAELTRREQEQNRAAAEREQRLQAAREDWARQTWDLRSDVDQELRQQGTQARDAFTEAVKAGDLPGAFTAWMTERASRYAREATRNRAVQAGHLLGDPQAQSVADVRWYTPDFLTRLEEEADKQARINGYDQADDITPEIPTSLED